MTRGGAAAGLGAAEAAAWVERLQQQHRYVQELWS